MKKKLAAEHIDFADSEYISFHMSEDSTLTIYLKSWNAKSLRIVFSHAIQFSYKLASDPSNLFQIEDNRDLEKMLVETHGHVPPNHPFKLFVIEDIDDFPFIQVVAESVVVVKE
jgi:hypothetical protein